MSRDKNFLSIVWDKLKSWEGFLLLLLILIIIGNTSLAPNYLSIGNQINLFILSIEKIIVALVMAFIIINAEIDLSVASMMGLSACTLAWLYSLGVSIPVALLAGLLVGVLGGAFNAFWIARIGLPSLVVTLAMLIGFRGLARVLLEDRSIGDFPEWFDLLGQQPLIGPFYLALLIFFLFVIIAIVLLEYSGFGRLVYVIGNNREVAEYSGVRVNRIKTILFIASSTVAALAGLLFAARLGAVRGDLAWGFELDIITMVLLGGVSIFGGSGSIYGVLFSIMIVLNLRNGMSLANITGHVQTGVIGVLLILSVLVPNMTQAVRTYLNRRRLAEANSKQSEQLSMSN
ncbi:MAG: ABC transporter permease [Chloroflexi bacterium]|nr:ABC transporter permease [Chloroflexota bacterium]